MRNSPWWKVARELLFIAVFIYFYELIRGSVVQSGAVATRHALWIVDIERSVGLFVERGVQSVFLSSHAVVGGFNLYYGGTHFLVPAAVLIWLGVRHPAHYSRARNLLMATTVVGFACFWLFPVAPPRLLPAHFEIVDTIRHLDGTRAVATLIDRAGNAYAALPSLHVAWAVWCTMAVYQLLEHRWSRVVALLYPVATILAVVVTGNHFVADCVMGTVLVLGVAWVLDRVSLGVIREVGVQPAEHATELVTMAAGLDDPVEPLERA